MELASSRMVTTGLFSAKIVSSCQPSNSDSICLALAGLSTILSYSWA